MRRRTLFASVGLAVVLLGSCGGDSEPKAGTTGTPTATTSGNGVTLKSFAFAPPELSVAMGTTVTWTNRDDVTHTVTSGKPGTKSGLFDKELSGPGTSTTFAFSTAGEFPYFCNIHQSMTGKVIVT